MTALFIGLGMMGDPMARNLAGAVDLALYDVNTDAATRLGEKLGVRVLDALDPLPEDIDTVILMVPNSRIVESLVRTDAKLLERLPSRSLIIDMSSSEPESTRALATEAAQHGIDYVDAPVSGGVAKARTGELAIMVGATEAGFERAQPYLQALGTSIHHVGDPGSGDAAKALNNLLSATNLAAAAEVISAAARFGVAPEKMVAVLNSSTGRSQATEVKYPDFILSGTFASGFGMDLMLKDLAIARSLTSGAGLVAPITDAAGTVAARSRAIAGSPPDHTEIARYYEASNDVLIRR